MNDQKQGWICLNRFLPVLISFCVIGTFHIDCLAQAIKARTTSSSSRIQYKISIDVDYANASYEGLELVRFTNTGRQDIDSLNFNIYPNLGVSENEPPLINIKKVSADSHDLKFSFKTRYSSIKVELPAKLSPGKTIELTLVFTGNVPRLQREEASLLAHFLQELNDAMSEDKQPRDTRDIFFAAEESVLLGYFYPVLAAPETQLSDQVPAVGVSGLVFSEVADYEVSVIAGDNLTVIGSAQLQPSSLSQDDRKIEGRLKRVFKGTDLRGFAIILAEKMKFLEEKIGEQRVISYFREGDEVLGKRALNIAVGSLVCYQKAFGPYPYPFFQVVEMPLPAGFSAVEFPSLVALAQAYYIDFDRPQSSRLPAVLQEQSDVIKSSFEFTLAHGVAHQWWGCEVGSDSEKWPYLDESLATFSAAYYHEAAYGKKLGELIIDQQLRGTYQAYKMLGGADLEADKPTRDYKNSLQYSAIVQTKGALLLVELREKFGDEKFFNSLRYYYSTHRKQIARPEHLRYAFLASAEDTREVRRLFQRWLREKHADEDIPLPDLTLNSQPVSRFRSLGRIFLKIGRAARPF
ncbi:MAG: hypothetical protein IPG76_13385 [Acidobacteria bacterium]|nr:hypothetical protein [Acidobacteriota bacterium]